ncbi:hypothetical protein RHSIM_Rhsim07G0171000 [Rhododendron simsii]|uniref:Uncharacterized protein n=1 Tax=Rhododendron simsii TaxID=118357 RepID=A0A834GRF9_RHOSS|nr:hypothetical protein RHSIM_Rhsim07G0171000 [Rhododendron simsii]
MSYVAEPLISRIEGCCRPESICDEMKRQHMANLWWGAKQGWRLLLNEGTLIQHVLKAKYFPSSSFVEASAGSNPSWTWQSILEGRRVLVEGIRWRIGNGRRVGCDQDPWIPRPNGFCPINATEGRGMRVYDLIDTENAALVHAIPLSSLDLEDRWIWHYSSQGMYTVSSGNKTALMLERQGRNSGGGGGQLSRREANN